MDTIGTKARPVPKFPTLLQEKTRRGRPTPTVAPDPLRPGAVIYAVTGPRISAYVIQARRGPQFLASSWHEIIADEGAENAEVKAG
jgi:hypothetical protein